VIENSKDFYNNKTEFLIFDPIVGWRNRPNSNKLNWQIDENGARTTHPLGVQRSDKKRVLFLGSSLVNGGMNVSNDETISFFIEDSNTEALNFATMLYSVDQSCLAYEHDLKKYNPQIVVVGLSGNPTDGLVNQYIPFRMVEEENIPFLKPRFIYNSGILSLIGLPPLQSCRNILKDPELLQQISGTDEYYSEFTAYKSFGFTPLAAAARNLFRRTSNFINLINTKSDNLDLLVAIMNRLSDNVQSHDAQIVFMILPNLQTTSPSGWRKYLPDQYAFMVNRLKGEKFTIYDIRDTLIESGQSLWKLYGKDHGHYSPEGNRIIAKGLKKIINDLNNQLK